MPNWFIATISIDTNDENKDVLDKLLKDMKDDDDIGLEVLDPCPGEGISEESDYWGTKWGTCYTKLEEVGCGKYTGEYMSPWRMPCKLFKHLEDKYYWIIESKGYDDSMYFIEMYSNGNFGGNLFSEASELVKQGFLKEEYMKDGKFNDEEHEYEVLEEAKKMEYDLTEFKHMKLLPI